MSSHLRRERRDWSRVPPQVFTRQEWVPRGSSASSNNADVGSSNQGVVVASTPVTRHRSNNHGNDAGSSSQGVAIVTPPVTRHRRKNHGNGVGSSSQGVAVAAESVTHRRSNNNGNDVGSSSQGVVVATLPVTRHRSNNHGNYAGSSNHRVVVAVPLVTRHRSNNHENDVGSSNQGVVVAGPLMSHHGINNHGNDVGFPNQGVAVPQPAGRGRSNNHGKHKMEKERVKGRSSGYQVGKGLGVGVRDSTLPQLVQEIQEKLLIGTAECLICFERIQRSASVWSCSSCYCIFHVPCIKKWAEAPNAIDLSVFLEKNLEPNWRCPGCQSVKFIPSNEIRYTCFCGKRIDPPSDLYLIPHSCGEPCGKRLEILVAGGNRDDICPHTCVLQCHPGPCPTCKAFAPPRLCPCGKKNITTRCSDRKSVLTCGQCCGKLLECGRHCCERICHLGPCDPCQVLINASCFCSKRTDVMTCGDVPVRGEIEATGGVFSCGSYCRKKLGCGNHVCREICHPSSCRECESLPRLVETCYCGKTVLENERLSCLDPIPTCFQVCDKILHCGLHSCTEACHFGECPPCSVQVSQKCRCGSTSRIVECYKTMMENENFICEKSCGSKKNCGRHRCSAKCCPFSNTSRNDNNLSEGWAPHFCSMPCGKKLRCGQHLCACLCHSGHCPPCFETIFTELTCACGRTSIPPPLPCGTLPPSCQLPCLVPQPCGHSGSHTCHFGDCPPCSVPVAKECIGEHVVLRNIPCGSKDIRCNHPCGKTRQCGLHVCGRKCHPPPCDNLSGVVQAFKVPCGQTCGAPRRSCQHTCMAPCHPSSPCPDIRCEFPVTITCSCGNIIANVPCDAGGSSSNYNADAIHEASIIQTLPVPLKLVDANDKKVPLGQRKLMCDVECAKLERKRVLEDAFDITAPNLDSLHFGVNSLSSELLSDFFKREPKWILAVEERCKMLVLGKSRGTTHGLKVHVFCPMTKAKRDVVRLIAERRKLAVKAAGWEPKRFIVIFVTPKSRAPYCVIGVKGTTTLNAPLPSVFDPLVDMDPWLVVSFPDLPRDADISALVLRFGGECELVWLNDKNALAVFYDPARAATAMRRLDHTKVYQGAILVAPNVGALAGSSTTNAWGTAGAMKEGGAMPALKGNSWKKVVIQDPGWKDSWGNEECIGSMNVHTSVWKKEAPIAVASNRWNVLDQDSGSSSSFTAIRTDASRKQTETSCVSNEGENLDAAEDSKLIE